MGFTACQLLTYRDDKLGTVLGNAEIWKRRDGEEGERKERREEGGEATRKGRRREEGGGRGKEGRRRAWGKRARGEESKVEGEQGGRRARGDEGEGKVAGVRRKERRNIRHKLNIVCCSLL